MIQFVTIDGQNIQSIILAAHNYQNHIPGSIPPQVLGGGFNFWVVGTGNGIVNITYKNRAHTWNGVSIAKAHEYIAAAYEKETPCAVRLASYTILNDPLEGIGLQVTHRLFNGYGERLISYYDNIYEKVSRIGVDIYDLHTMAIDGEWTDFHRFPPGKPEQFNVGIKTTHQYWYTAGVNAKRITESGYFIIKTIEDHAPHQRKVKIEKHPSKVEILGVKIDQAEFGAASIEFYVEISDDGWKQINI
jgi:hypothetical protein